MNEADPRIIALEEQFSQLHIQLFNTFSHAQSAVMSVMQSGRDIDETNEDFEQLQRDFAVSVVMYTGPNNTLKDNITATKKLARDNRVTNVHLTQVWAAAVSAMCCERMLAMIPEDLRADPLVAGELIQKRNEHLTMWQERLANP